MLLRNDDVQPGAYTEDDVMEFGWSNSSRTYSATSPRYPPLLPLLPVMSMNDASVNSWLNESLAPMAPMEGDATNPIDLTRESPIDLTRDYVLTEEELEQNK